MESLNLNVGLGLGELKKMVPVNMRQYAYTLAGGNEGLKLQDFTDEDLATIRGAVDRVMKSTGKNEGVIGYGDYSKDGSIKAEERDGLLAMIGESFTDPAFRMETTLGMAKYKVNPNGELEVSDAYDFNAKRSYVNKLINEKGVLPLLFESYRSYGMWGLANALGNIFSKADAEGTPYTLNLGRVKK